MKKAFASVAVGLTFGAVSAVSALDMSVGGVVHYVGDYGGGFYGLSASERYYVSNYEYSEYELSSTVPWSGFGFGGFFDLTYAEISLSLTWGGGNPENEYYEDGYLEESGTNKGVDISFTSLNIGVLGKYPIALADKMMLFPAIGLEYAFVVSGKSEEGRRTYKLNGKNDYPDASDFSALWIKFGGGLDYNLNGKVFLHSELLYGIRFTNKFENDKINDFYYNLDHYGGSDDNGYCESILGHGLTIKVGVGFRL